MKHPRSMNGLLWEELTKKEQELLMSLLRRQGPFLIRPDEDGVIRRWKVYEGTMKGKRIVGIAVLIQDTKNPVPEGKCPTIEHGFECCLICNHGFPGVCDTPEEHELL